MKMPIRVYNRFLDLLMETSAYQSLQYKRSYHSIVDFELHINRYMHGADEFQKGNIIALNKQENKTGIILTREIELDENGKESENFKLTGITMDGIMNRRVSVPPADTAYDRKSGDAETVMKHYVNNHFVNPADPSRKLDKLEIAPNQRRGEHVAWESRFKDIGEELEKISIESGLGWGIFVDFNTKKLIFDCFQAKNLTQNNEFGYSPVFFSPEFETIKSQSFIDSDTDYKNAGYVGGQGEGVERKIIVLGNNSGWDRIETFVDARDIGTEDEESEEELTEDEIEEMLIDRGQKKMKEMETIFSLEAEILTPVKKATPFQYEKDFDLGDRVQVVNKSWGLTMTAPITEFLEIHEPSGFRLEATFGQSRPTLLTKIKDKFNELEGIEKQEAPTAIAVEYMKKAMQYGDEKLTEEERKRIEQAIANLEASRAHAENYTSDYTYEKGAIDEKDSESERSAKEAAALDATSKANAAREAAESLAVAKANLAETQAKAHADSKISDEEKRAIQDAKDKLEEAKNHAYLKASEAETAAKAYAETKANEAQTAAEAVAEAKARLAEERAIANADGKITTEERARIKQAEDNLAAAKSDAKIKANVAESAAKKHAETKDEQVRKDAANDAKEKADEAERKANNFSKDATNIMEGILDVGAVPIRTSYSGARINFDGINGFVQYDKNDNPVAWFDLEGNARFSGDITGATGTFGEVAVKGGDFTLEDEVSGLNYVATPRRNVIKDHSFELVRQDNSSLNQESVEHNWLDIKTSIHPFEDSPWIKSGSPKVSIQFSPDTKDSLAIFGEKAIIVRNAHYVSQFVYDGIAAGSSYTVSGHFKRQWNSSGGGTPRIEIWHVNALGSRQSKIVNTIFEPVRDDYSIARHATTFTTPSNYAFEDSLEVIISGGNNNWIQCDGVQMVEGSRAAIYQPEDSIWEIAKGNYRPIKKVKTLWTGVSYPRDIDVLYPELTLEECSNGWLLEWSAYTKGAGASDYRYVYTTIPKEMSRNAGKSMTLRIPNTAATGATQKYLYITNETITGYSGNNSGDNAENVIRNIYEY